MWYNCFTSKNQANQSLDNQKQSTINKHPDRGKEEIKMTLEQILVIAATAWIYAKIGNHPVEELKKQERREIAAGRRTA